MAGLMEGASTESQVTRGLRAQLDDRPSLAATVALAIFTVMQINGHGAVTCSQVKSFIGPQESGGSIAGWRNIPKPLTSCQALLYNRLEYQL
jgi:hypothetical protein